MDYDSFLELVKSRRSIRRFKPDPIPDDCVDKIIEAARWAPSGFNQQPWEFVVIKDQDLKRAIIQLISDLSAQTVKMETIREPRFGTPRRPRLNNQLDYSTAPVFILLLGDTRTRAGLPMHSSYDFQRYQSLFTSGLACAFLYMHMAAATLGLAGQWITSVRVPYVHCLVNEVLGIPKEIEPYGILAVGYPAVKPRPKFMRNKDKLIHYDRCDKEDFRTDEEVYDFIRRSRTWVIATENRSPD